MQTRLFQAHFLLATVLILVVTRAQCILSKRNDENEECWYRYFSNGKLRGDNDYQLVIDGSENGLMPNMTYTVRVTSRAQTGTSGDFQSWSLLSSDDQGRPFGTFHTPDGTITAVVHPRCPNRISSSQWRKQKTFVTEWTAPNEISSECVYFRATIHVSRSVSFAEDGGLTVKLCSVMDKGKAAQCCACGFASYSVTFKGLWSRDTHPKSWPPESLVHWGNIVGAVHGNNFTLWRTGQYASEGIKHLALYGASSMVEAELAERAQRSNDIREIVLMDGRWTTKLNEPISANISVSNAHHMLSLASMFGPSPDWFSGIDSLSLCNADCTWKLSHVEYTKPYDAGVDAGVTYVANKVPQVPPQRISQITAGKPADPRNPFYSPGHIIPPMACITIERIATYGTQCPNGTADSTIPTLSMDEMSRFQALSRRKLLSQAAPTKPKRNRSFHVKLIDQDSLPECAVTEWSDWSQCRRQEGAQAESETVQTRTRKYKDPIAASKFPCSQILVEKKPCTLETPGGENVSCLTSEWSEWSKCSEKCGLGKKTRWRKLLSPDKRCLGKVTLRESMDCKGESASCHSGLKLDMFEKKRVCMQPKPSGTCGDAEDRYYLDFESRKCKKFKYGGCDGSENNFKTIEECENFCDILLLGRTSSGVDSRCVTLPWSDWSECSNPCGPGIQTRHRQYKSKPLALGFCGETLYESRPCNGTSCDNAKPLSDAERTQVCSSTVEPGPCKESITRYYYDTITKSCLPFKYGGCSGNSNNFLTLGDCERTCLENRDKSPIHKSECGYYVWTPWSDCKRSSTGQLIQTRNRKLITSSADMNPNCRLFASHQETRLCGGVGEQAVSKCRHDTWSYTLALLRHDIRTHSSPHKPTGFLLEAILVTHSSRFSLLDWSADEFALFEAYLRDGFTEPVVEGLLAMKDPENSVLDVKEFSLQSPAEQRLKFLVDTAHPAVSIFAVALVNHTTTLLGLENARLLVEEPTCKWVNLSTKFTRLAAVDGQFPQDYVTDEAAELTGSFVGQLHVNINTLARVSEKEKDALFIKDPRCELTDWSDWSPCSVACGKGIQSRARTYRSLKAAATAGCDALLRQNRICYATKTKCDVTDKCRTTEWSAWSPCSVSCGIGVTTRTRSFVDPESVAECQGLKVALIERKPCQGDQCEGTPTGPEKFFEICRLPLVDGSPCRSDLVRFYYNHSVDRCVPFRFGGCNQNANNFETIDQCESTCKSFKQALCMYGNWSSWSDCSERCGGGTRQRHRKLVSGGRHCNSTQTQTERCNEDIVCDSSQKCNDLRWSAWSECIGPCGEEGIQSRQQIPDGKNLDCPVLREFRYCSVPASCPRKRRNPTRISRHGTACV